MSISWTCLKHLSHYMLRVEQERKWRQPSMYWGMTWSKVDVWWLRISRKSSVRLLLNIIFVSFIVCQCILHNTSNTPIQLTLGIMILSWIKKKKRLLGCSSWCETSIGDKGYDGAEILLRIEWINVMNSTMNFKLELGSIQAGEMIQLH